MNSDLKIIEDGEIITLHPDLLLIKSIPEKCWRKVEGGRGDDFIMLNHKLEFKRWDDERA